MRKFYIFLILILFISVSASSQPRHPAFVGSHRDSLHDYDVLNYEINISADESTETISGVTIITMQSVVDNFATLELDFGDNMTISQITLNDGIPQTDFSQADNLLIINLTQSFDSGDTFDISIAYSGTPQDGFYFHSPGFYTVSFNNLARFWFPCFDHPTDKATAQMNVTVPDTYLVACNGVLTDETDNGDGTKTFFWSEDYLISTYLICITAGEYAYFTDSYGEMPLEYWVYPDQLEQAQETFSDVPNMVDWFSQKFGEYPFINEKYAMAVAPINFLAMEHQNCTTIRPSLVNPGMDNQFTIAHELSHMWWGDAVSPAEWAEIWLNEGFATYSEGVYMGRNDFEILKEHMDECKNLYFGEDNSARFPIYDPPEQYFLGYTVYRKGAYIMHMLRHVVGDSAFYGGLQHYYDENIYSNATTPIFQSDMEDVYGDDLTWFFDEWVYQAGYPEYAVLWDSWETDGTYTLEMKVKQNQEDAPIFEMPIPVVTFDGAGEMVDSTLVQNQEDAEYYTLNVDNAVDSLAFDPHGWVLCKKDVRQQSKLEMVKLMTTDVVGDGDGSPEAGETVELSLELFNHYTTLTNVSATLTVESNEIIVDDGDAAFTDINTDETGDNHDDPFVFTVDGDPHYEIPFSVTFSSEEGYSATLDFEIYVGWGTILLVDDDEGMDYEDYYLEVLDVLALNPEENEHWDVELRGPISGGRLMDYTSGGENVVIWFTGDAEENTLTEADRTNLAQYLDSDGKFFLTGQDIGLDIGDTDFYADYLKSEFLLDDHGVPKILNGVSGTLGDGLVLNISGEGGADNQDSPSEIEPLEGAVKCFGYLPNQAGGGVQITSDYDNQIVYFSFGFEAVTQTGPNTTDRFTLMATILDWLDVISGVADYDLSELPAKTVLYQNYPNPFNPQTEICFQVNNPSMVSLKIYDVAGKLIKTLIDDELTPNRYSLIWDGTDETGTQMPSGIYFYTLKLDEYEQTKQMILVK